MLYMEEKRIPYRVEKIDLFCYGTKKPSFLALQPSGMVPAAVVDGHFLGNADAILGAAEAAFTDAAHPPLFGSDKALTVLQSVLKHRFVESWMVWLTSVQGVGERKSTFLAALGDVEASVVGPYFQGAHFTVMDALFAPFLDRAVASLCYFKGFLFRGQPAYPKLTAWYEVMETRGSYQTTKSDHYSLVHELFAQLGGCDVTSREAAAWHLPWPAEAARGEARAEAEALAEMVEPSWGWVSPSAARREVVERLVGNHAMLATFCTRAVVPSRSKLAAPRADPDNPGYPDMAPAASVLLLFLARQLLDASDTPDLTPDGTRVPDGTAGASDGPCSRPATGRVEVELRGAVALLDEASRTCLQLCLAYLRDRIGCPRDMSLPAARLFRSHINWAIDLLGTGKD
jgi:glutathione S-transferase